MSDAAVRDGNMRRWILTGGTVLFFVTLLLNPDKASEAVSGGMTIFAEKLIPVLFPYMVLSHFFCTYGLLDPLAGLLPVGRLFGMDACAFSVFSMGHLCGYPVGAKMAAESVRQGKITPEQGAVLCAASGGASPAFLLHVTGGMLWGDIRLGMVLFGCQVLNGLAVGELLGHRCSCLSARNTTEAEPVPFSRCLCEAVGGSAVQLVSIGGYIVFFSLLAAILPFGDTAGVFVSAVLEFSTGVRLAASLGGWRGLFFTGFAVGFGGLSVLAQTAHMLSGSGISLRIYVMSKLCSGIFCGLGALCYGMLRPGFDLCRNVTAGLTVVGNRTDLVWFALVLVMMWYFAGVHRGTGR